MAAKHLLRTISLHSSNLSKLAFCEIVPGLNSAKSFRCFSTANQLFSSRKFTDKHEWITVDGKIGTVGISNYAQESLGEIVYAQLPDIGAILTLMGECGALESVKAASDLYSPAAGKVTEVNKAVQDDASLINKSPYDKGWLFKMEVANPGEVDKLMDEKSYEKYLKTLEVEQH